MEKTICTYYKFTNTT